MANRASFLGRIHAETRTFRRFGGRHALAAGLGTTYAERVGRPRLGETFEVLLPSGRTIELCAKRVAGASDLRQAIELGAISVPSAAELRALPLCDANVVEGILAAIGAFDREPVVVVCRNCGDEVEMEPAATLPVAPLLKPPGDEELDRPPSPIDAWDREALHPLPRTITVGRRHKVDRVLLARRTFADREALERLLPADDEDDPGLEVSPRLVRALGISAVARDQTRVTSAIAIARAIEALRGQAFWDVWDAIVRAFDAQHWPPRLLAACPCPKCGARNDVEVVRLPLEWVDELRAQKHDAAPFPDLAEFRARAAAITREVLAGTRLEGLPGLEVIVDDDVPPCDEGGEPILGCYTPAPDIDDAVRLDDGARYTITLFYRSFRADNEIEPYDVDAEIRETIDHELEHHVGFLRGHDPLADEEHEEIAREHARRRGAGKSEEIAASVGWLAGDFARFLRVTWPLWVLALFGVLLLLASSR